MPIADASKHGRMHGWRAPSPWCIVAPHFFLKHHGGGMASFGLVLLGAAVGTFGTMIGAGGGFILVPVLLFLYPQEKPEVVTAISLAVVFCNALSGSIAYARNKRIDYKSGVVFAIASVPGAILGVLSTHWISRELFEPIFGIGLIAISLYLLFKKSGGVTQEHKGKASTTRTLVDAEGHSYTYTFDARIGIILSVFVGYISSFLGIGGGVIHVPALVHLLDFPIHLATATSHFILAIMAFVGTVEHGISGSLAAGMDRLIFLAPGVVIGAQFGAKLSARVRGSLILKLLAGALLLVGVRLMF